MLKSISTFGLLLSITLSVSAQERFDERKTTLGIITGITYNYAGKRGTGMSLALVAKHNNHSFSLGTRTGMSRKSFSQTPELDQLGRIMMLLEGNYRCFSMRKLGLFRPFLQLTAIYGYGRLDGVYLFESEDNPIQGIEYEIESVHHHAQFLIGGGLEYYIGKGVSVQANMAIGTAHGKGTVEYRDPDSGDVEFYESESFHITSIAVLAQTSFIFRF